MSKPTFSSWRERKGSLCVLDGDTWVSFPLNYITLYCQQGKQRALVDEGLWHAIWIQVPSICSYEMKP